MSYGTAYVCFWGQSGHDPSPLLRSLLAVKRTWLVAAHMQHGGSIEVDTQPGEFTEIRVTLPRVAAS
jgi:hypothetical protein